MAQSEEIRKLKETISQLEEENAQLLGRNMQLSDQLCMWYELRQRVNWLKEEMLNDQRKIQRADMADDGELFASIEARLEQDMKLLTPDFDGEALAKLLGVSNNRLKQLFQRNSIYKSADNYLDYLRLIRAMQMLREHPEYGVVAVSEEAGFNSVRTFQRRMAEAVGMTPVEFRMMVERG
jgi:transcriptional regulator GlxA family with amidase domain